MGWLVRLIPNNEWPLIYICSHQSDKYWCNVHTTRYALSMAT